MVTTELIDHEAGLKERLARQSDKTYQLSPRVLQNIEQALQQVKDGQTIPGETVFREIDEWLGDD